MSPSIEILEQPALDKLRFRYKSEKLSSVMEGITSTKENKTYPTIRIMGCTGMTTIGISLVTHTEPYRRHPHKILYKETSKLKMRSEGGALRTDVNVNGSEQIVLDGISVMCEKKDTIENIENLNYKSFNLNAARLAFELYINGVCKCRVFSEPFFDSKSVSKLGIFRICCPSSEVTGGTEKVLLCDKVQKKDIKVQFLDRINDVDYVWETVEPYVHGPKSIIFKTPPYKRLDIDQPVQTYLRLMRPSDKSTGPSIPFEFYPSKVQKKHVKRTKISANAICHSNVTVNHEESIRAKRNKLTICNIKPEIATSSQPTPGYSQENRLIPPSPSYAQQQQTPVNTQKTTKPSVSCIAQPQSPQFQQPPQSFQCPTYQNEHNNYHMYDTHATNPQPAYSQQRTYQQPAQQVTRNIAPPQSHNQFQNANLNYTQAAFDGSPYHTNNANYFGTPTRPIYDATPVLQPQPASSSWNIQSHATNTWYRGGNNLGRDHRPLMNYNDNFTVPRYSDKASVITAGTGAQNLSNIVDEIIANTDINPDLIDLDGPLFSSMSNISIGEVKENTPTR